MLPKILRIRRELVFSPLVVLRGASIALVAMCFPALCGGAHGDPASLPAGRAVLWSAAPRPSPMRSVRALFGPCPGEDGKSPGRTSPCGGADYLLDLADIVLFQQRASLRDCIKKAGRPNGRPALPLLQGSSEVEGCRHKDLARIAIERGRRASLAQRRLRLPGAVQDKRTGDRVHQEEVVAGGDIFLVR